MNKKNNTGFTLIELMIAITVLIILASVAVSDFVLFKKNSDLDNNVQEFISIIKVAQNKTLSSENYSQYGVYINTAVSPNQYILFKGINYASRDTSADKIYSLQDTVEFYGVSIAGGNEIVFDRLTGSSEESGNVSIRIKTDINKNKTIYIANSGVVSLNSPTILSDTNRIADSRHIEFNYSRVINTANENIILTFNNTETTIIPISSYLTGGEIQWQGTVNVGGTDQIVEISTHRLNNPDTLFSVHRDRRYNNVSLKITISGDSSGYLAQYSSNGLTINYSSAYVSGFARQ